MKGAILDWIRSVADRITSDSILQYKVRYELGDLDDDSLITKYLLLNSAPPPAPDPLTIVAGITVNPLTIAYDGRDTTSYTLRRALDDSFDWNTKVTYDGSDFVITGDDDGTGHFADGFIFQVRP